MPFMNVLLGTKEKCEKVFPDLKETSVCVTHPIRQPVVECTDTQVNTDMVMSGTVCV